MSSTVPALVAKQSAKVPRTIASRQRTPRAGRDRSSCPSPTPLSLSICHHGQRRRRVRYAANAGLYSSLRRPPCSLMMPRDSHVDRLEPIDAFRRHETRSRSRSRSRRYPELARVSRSAVQKFLCHGRAARGGKRRPTQALAGARRVHDGAVPNQHAGAVGVGECDEMREARDFATPTQPPNSWSHSRRNHSTNAIIGRGFRPPTRGCSPSRSSKATSRHGAQDLDVPAQLHLQ